MSLPVTTLYVLPLVVIWAALWVGVVRQRVQQNQSLGDGGHDALLISIRRHGNFIEWVPFVLVLLVLAEVQGAPVSLLHAAGALLVLGRAAHPFGLGVKAGINPLRLLGNVGNLAAVAILFVALLRIALTA